MTENIERVLVYFVNPSLRSALCNPHPRIDFSSNLRHKAYLRNHEKIHSENKYWNCRLCGTKFSSRSAFQRHFLRRHKNEKMYGCDDCGFYTDSFILQNKHMTSETHLSVKTQTIQSIPSTNYNWPKTKPSFNHFRDGALDIDINRLPNVSNLKVTPTYLV